jgi:hypothetical protein
MVRISEGMFPEPLVPVKYAYPFYFSNVRYRNWHC